MLYTGFFTISFWVFSLKSDLLRNAVVEKRVKLTSDDISFNINIKMEAMIFI